MEIIVSVIGTSPEAVSWLYHNGMFCYVQWSVEAHTSISQNHLFAKVISSGPSSLSMGQQYLSTMGERVL